MNPSALKTAASLFVGGMEACWIISILRLVESWIAPGALFVPLTMLGAPLAFGLWRLARRLSRPRRLSVVLTAGLAWIMVLIRFSAFPASGEPAGWMALVSGLFQLRSGPNPLQITALAAAATWMAGLRLSTRQAGIERILSEFQFGLLILLCVFFGAAQWRISLPVGLPVVFIFFTLFLLGTATVRNAEADGRTQRGAHARWQIAFVLNAALVLGLGLLLTIAFTPQLLSIALAFFQAVWDALTDWVVHLIAFLARLIPQPELKSVGIGGGAAPPPQNPGNLPDLLSIPDYVRRIAGGLVAAFWVALFAVCLWRMASQIAAWLRRLMNDPETAQIDSLPGSFRRDLRRLLRYVRRRVTGWIGWLRYAIGRRFPEKATPDGSAAVRRVYRGLLAWSAAGGCLRRRHQTPHEFLDSLCEWLPQARVQLTLITEHYAAVRYGGRLPDAEAVKTLERIWQDVRQIRKRSKNPTKGTHY